MRRFRKNLISGLLGGVLIAAVLIAICFFSGMMERWFPDMGQAEVPGVTVITPVREDSLEKTEGQQAEIPIEEQQGEILVEEQEDDNSIHLLFAGDLFLTELLQEKYQRQGMEAAATARLLERLEAADVFMLNQEFPFGTAGEAMEEKEYTFRIHPDYVTVLQELSVDMVTLANNHVLDFGREPLTETFAALNDAGIPYVGAGNDLSEAKQFKTLEVKGKTIGFLGASRVIPESSWAATKYQSGVFTTYDPTQLLAEIQTAKEVCDFVVVYVHWGVEQSEQPEDYQKELARQYIDAGADAVIGSHPHVLQELEYYQGKPIVYSLGNFIFSNRDYETAMVELVLNGEGCEIQWIPCVSTANQMDLK